jgi:hypothetical protein
MLRREKATLARLGARVPSARSSERKRANVSAKSKQRVPPRKRKAEPKRTASILEQFHCDNVRYDFDLPIDSFKTKSFSKETGLKLGDQWEAVLPSDDPRSGYHVHFAGSLGDKNVHLRIDYWDLPVKRAAHHPAQSAESVMAFIGSFIREPSARTITLGRFEKPADAWRSRFNLPFKVTMAGAEVVIDGVSVVLPKNRFNAMNGWLTKFEDSLLVSVDRVRQIEFAAFDLAEEVKILNESIKMFVEQTT